MRQPENFILRIGRKALPYIIGLIVLILEFFFAMTGGLILFLGPYKSGFQISKKSWRAMSQFR